MIWNDASLDIDDRDYIRHVDDLITLHANTDYNWVYDAVGSCFKWGGAGLAAVSGCQQVNGMNGLTNDVQALFSRRDPAEEGAGQSSQNRALPTRGLRAIRRISVRHSLSHIGPRTNLHLDFDSECHSVYAAHSIDLYGILRIPALECDSGQEA